MTDACTKCGCAPRHNGYNVCEDCLVLVGPGWGPQWYEPNEERVAASVSVGMRALCGTPWESNDPPS